MIVTIDAIGEIFVVHHVENDGRAVRSINAMTISGLNFLSFLFFFLFAIASQKGWGVTSQIDHPIKNYNVAFS